MDAVPRLTVGEAAARLGVKPESLYAYVSRGLLSRERGRAGSTFDPLEIEAFARSRRARTAPAAVPRTGGMPLMVLDTDIAQIEDDELYLRGRSAARLAEESDLESVAAWLWGMPDAGALRGLAPDGPVVAAVRTAVAALPASASLLDRMQVAVVALAATDPLRADATADGLRRAGARLLLGMPAALGAADAPRVGTDVAAAVWRALTGEEADAAERRVVSAALVLAVDHDLAVSALAARIAASARGSGYAVVTAALGAFATPLHGIASRGAAELLVRVRDGDPVDRALAASVAGGGRGIPGFGHPLYTGADPRALVLLPLVERLRGAAPVIAATRAVTDEVERRTGLRPNLDLAMAALTLAAELPADAGALLFALGRTAGWIAHGLAEYDQMPLRLRPRGRYVGP